MDPAEEFKARVGRHCSHGFAAGFDFVRGTPKQTIIDFPQDWLMEYGQGGYVTQDQVVAWGLGNLGRINWDDLERIDFGFDLDVIAKARAYGIPNGTSMAVSVNGMKCIVGVTHVDRDLTDAAVRDIHEAMCGHALHLWDTDRRPPDPKILNHVLYMRAVAAGKSDAEIAAELGVSKSALGQRRRNAILFLEAETLPQAVLHAFKRGWLGD